MFFTHMRVQLVVAEETLFTKGTQGMNATLRSFLDRRLGRALVLGNGRQMDIQHCRRVERVLM